MIRKDGRKPDELRPVRMIRDFMVFLLIGHASTGSRLVVRIGETASSYLNDEEIKFVASLNPEDLELYNATRGKEVAPATLLG